MRPSLAKPRLEIPYQTATTLNGTKDTFNFHIISEARKADDKEYLKFLDWLDELIKENKDDKITFLHKQVSEDSLSRNVFNAGNDPNKTKGIIVIKRGAFTEETASDIGMQLKEARQRLTPRLMLSVVNEGPNRLEKKAIRAYQTRINSLSDNNLGSLLSNMLQINPLPANSKELFSEFWDEVKSLFNPKAEIQEANGCSENGGARISKLSQYLETYRVSDPDPDPQFVKPDLAAKIASLSNQKSLITEIFNNRNKLTNKQLKLQITVVYRFIVEDKSIGEINKSEHELLQAIVANANNSNHHKYIMKILTDFPNHSVSIRQRFNQALQ